MKMLNVGCGKSYHPDWINCDINPVNSDVIRLDVEKKLPFQSSTFDACYSSHVIEHLEKNNVDAFISECFRVLKPGGVIRIVLPDLEALVKEYLRVLELVTKCDEDISYKYNWVMLELYDQCTRNSSGGMMKNFIEQLPQEYFPYIRSRIGLEFDEITSRGSVFQNKKLGLFDFGFQKIGAAFSRARVECAMILVYLTAGKRAYKNSRKGIFRGQGEIHQWMYDRYSATKILTQAGFNMIKVCGANDSNIPQFSKYSLDVCDGVPKKPDSFYIEAIKP